MKFSSLAQMNVQDVRQGGQAMYAAGSALPKYTSQLEAISCDQLGSNYGGMFKHKATGEKYYLKNLYDDDHSRCEVLASNLYALTDLQILDSFLVEVSDIHKEKGIFAPNEEGEMEKCAGLINTNYLVASKWIDGLTDVAVPQMADLPDVRRGLAMDAWVGHYDHVGNFCDWNDPEDLSCFNIKVQNGKAFRLDFGGVFEWKSGAKQKDPSNGYDIVFTGESVREWERYQERMHPFMSPVKGGDVFDYMSTEELISSLQVVANLSEERIIAAINNVFPEGERRNNMQSMLINRRKLLMKELEKETAILIQYQEDIQLFCSIDAIKLEDGSTGKISQAQKLNILKDHGFFGKNVFKKGKRPEALKDTLDRHGISKTGTLSLRFEQLFKDDKAKYSIQKMQKHWC